MTKTWFITGTSSGLGRLLTEKLLARGDTVAATLRKKGSLDELKAQYGDRLWVGLLDVTRTEQVHEVVDAAFHDLGHIDVIVSNAGYGLFGAAEEVSDAQIERQIATNLTGSIQLIRAVLPYLRAQNGGRLVQISSEGGQIAYPGFSLYHATKWGIEGFIESVAKEVAPFGIDCLIIEPGPTETNFAVGLDHAQPLACYEDTPVGDVRRVFTSGDFSSGTFTIKSDVVRTVDAMIAAADAETPPSRLALGSTTYTSIRQALTERLRVLEEQKDVTFSADRHS
ncbi:MAG: SDR family oxidoreductase [Alcanivorax sp.]|nr:SDR family oxidoreductase [Alcanivorax sp.]